MNTPYPIRKVERDDIPALNQACWSHHSLKNAYDKFQQLQSAMKGGTGLAIVVETEDKSQLIGYGQIMRLPRSAEISNLWVAEDYRSRGIGTAIIQYLIQNSYLNVDRIEIGVAITNTRALSLYQRLGFVEFSQRVLDLGDGVEEYIYLKLS